MTCLHQLSLLVIKNEQTLEEIVLFKCIIMFGYLIKEKILSSHYLSNNLQVLHIQYRFSNIRIRYGLATYFSMTFSKRIFRFVFVLKTSIIILEKVRIVLKTNMKYKKARTNLKMVKINNQNTNGSQRKYPSKHD